MRKLLLSLAFTVALFGQGNQDAHCDQQASTHCLIWRWPATMASTQTQNMPGKVWIDANGFTAFGVDSTLNDSTASGYVVNNVYQTFINQDNESRGASYVLDIRRTTSDQSPSGWDQFAIAGVIKLRYMNLPGGDPYIRGQQKAVASELYYDTPTAPYTANIGMNYEASLAQVAAGTTLTTWAGLAITEPGTLGSGGTVTNGYGVWIQDLSANGVLNSANAAAIKIDGAGNFGRIQWTHGSLYDVTGGLGTTGSIVADTSLTDYAGYYMQMPASNPPSGLTGVQGVIQYSCPGGVPGSGGCSPAVINIGHVHDVTLTGTLTTVNANISGTCTGAGCGLSGSFPVLNYGAKCDGTTDDAAAIQSAVTAAAAASGGGEVVFPPGSCKVLSTIDVPYTGHTHIMGAGKQLTKLFVPGGSGATIGAGCPGTGTFNGTAVIQFELDTSLTPPALHASGGEGVSDLSIQHCQPDTVTRANLVSYPPDIYCPNGCPYAEFEHLGLYMGQVGIQCSTTAKVTAWDSCRGIRITDVDLETFTDGVFINNAYDTPFLTDVHYWTGWDMTTNHQTIVATDKTLAGGRGTVAYNFGRIDGLVGANISAQGVWKFGYFHEMSSGNGGTWGQLSSVLLGDGYGGLDVDNGTISLSDCTMSQGVNNVPMLRTAGTSRLDVSGCWLIAGYATANAGDTTYSIQAHDSSRLTITDSTIQANSGSPSATRQWIQSTDTSELILDSNTLEPTGGTPDTSKPFMSIEGGSKLVMTGNKFSPDIGTVNFMTIANDGDHVIQNNSWHNWTYTLPALSTSPAGRYGDNNYDLYYPRFGGSATIGGATFGYGLNVTGPAIGTATGTAGFRTPGAGQGEVLDLALYATFQGTGDNGPRRAADIVAGFNGGAWGKEYLSLRVGGSNDSSIATAEAARLTPGALNVNIPGVQSGGLYVDGTGIIQCDWTACTTISIGNVYNGSFSGDVTTVAAHHFAVGAESVFSQVASGDGTFVGYNAAPVSGVYKALVTADRAGYLEFDNSGFRLKTTSGTQTAGSALSTVVDVLDSDSSGNVTFGGKVGIGTTNPVSLLNVVDTGNANPQGITIDEYFTGTSSAAFYMRKSRGTLVSPTTIANGDTVSRMGFYAYDGSNFQDVADIRSVVNGAVSAGTVPTDMTFFTTTTNTGVERMRITSGGNVGIGKVPTRTLDVLGNTALTGAGGNVPLSIWGETTTPGADLLDVYNQWGGTNVFQTTYIGQTRIAAASASAIPLTIYGYTAQAADFLDVQSIGGTTTYFRIANDGTIGILGDSTSTTPFFGVSKNWPISAAANLTAAWTAYGDAARFVIRKANGTSASPTQVLSGDAIGTIGFRGYDSGGTFGSVSSANIAAYATEDFTASAHGTLLDFMVTPAGGIAQLTAMQIADNGNVTLGKKIVSVNGSATAGFGMMTTYAVVDIAGQSGGMSTSLLIGPSNPPAGSYEVSIYMDSGTATNIGWTLAYTDRTGARTITSTVASQSFIQPTTIRTNGGAITFTTTTTNANYNIFVALKEIS